MIRYSLIDLSGYYISPKNTPPLDKIHILSFGISIGPLSRRLILMKTINPYLI